MSFDIKMVLVLLYMLPVYCVVYSAGENVNYNTHFKRNNSTEGLRINKGGESRGKTEIKNIKHIQAEDGLVTMNNTNITVGKQNPKRRNNFVVTRNDPPDECDSDECDDQPKVSEDKNGNYEINIPAKNGMDGKIIKIMNENFVGNIIINLPKKGKINSPKKFLRIGHYLVIVELLDEYELKIPQPPSTFSSTVKKRNKIKQRE